MQAWGTFSRFDIRRTDLEPSKSGVIGLLCAALGRTREEPVADLCQLRMGVRVDREGVVRYDYQTAARVLRASGSGIQETVQSWRWFLADAAFLVGLEAEDQSLLVRIHDALRDPCWALFLGRKGYVPSPPVWLPDGLQPSPLEEALAGYPCLVGEAPEAYRYVLEHAANEPPAPGATWVRRTDQPISSYATRYFGERYVWIGMVPRGEIPRVPV